MIPPDKQAQRSSSPDDPRRPKVLVRDNADIDRLMVHLVTHWTSPRIEICIDSFPATDVQRAQNRIARLSDACNCLFGELLATATVLGGSYYVWTLRQGWRQLGWVVITALVAGLVGKGLQLAWTRVRLLWLLHRLRHRPGAGKTIDNVATHRQAKAEPARLAVRDLPESPLNTRAAAEDHPVATDNPGRRLLPHGPARPKVHLSNGADMDRLVLHLAAHWTLPRIEICIDALPELATQRAQHEIVRLSNACNCLLAGLSAGAALLGGAFYIVWMSSSNLIWYLTPGFGPLGWLVVLVLGAALTGWVIEVAWTRLRLLRVLLRLRSQLAALEHGT